jgi:hypothetical protein
VFRRLDAIAPSPARLLPEPLVDRLAMAEPMGRQLVAHALTGRELRWAEDRVTAARDAARVITQAAVATWEREIAAVAGDTDLDVALLRTAVVDAVDNDTPLHRLAGRDRRDDLDRGQHALPTAADIAALGAPRRATSVRPAHPGPVDDGPRLLGVAGYQHSRACR